jgi:small GTP-binding protein
MLPLKICFLGDPGVGKTSVIKRLQKSSFDPHQSNTIGTETIKYTLDHQGEQIEITFWDVPGQDQYRDMFSLSYRRAHAVFLVFDVTNDTSFPKIKKIWESVSDDVPSGCALILIANKVDLQKERVVFTGAIKEKVKEVKAKDYVEFSALNGFGEEDLKQIIFNLTRASTSQNEPPVIIIDNNPNPQPPKPKCCK